MASDGRAIVGVAWLNSIGQRRDDFDLRAREPGQHAGQLGERLGAGLHPDALAALARVVELQLVVLGDDLLGHRQAGLAGRRRNDRGGRRLGVARVSPQELEGHVGLSG